VAAKERDGAAMAAAVPDDMIDAIGVACTPAELARRVAVHKAEVDHLNLAAPVWGLAPEEAEHATRQILTAMTTSAHPNASGFLD